MDMKNIRKQNYYLAAKNASLTGFEFAGGIPGTLGGAVVMNAGAYGGEMKDILKEVTVMTEKGEILTLPAEELEMGYRTSIIKKKGYLVLGAVIVLEQGEQEVIKARMKELTEQRVSKQPLEYPSAGSTFKRPEGYFAGKLIMDAGLCGYQTGGAQVSEKHCGFVINKGNATATDVCRLIKDVQDKVKEQFDYLLNTDASEALFAGANPFTPRPDGTLLCEYVLSVVAAFIEKELDVRVRKTSAKVKKYTDKYKK